MTSLKSLVVGFLFLSTWSIPTGISAETSSFIINRLVLSDSITQEELAQIFLFQVKLWPNNAKVTVILPPVDSIAFRTLAVEELGMSSNSYYELLKAKEYSGRASLNFASSESFVVIKVAQTPYSIGYFSNSMAINAGLGIKILKVR